MHTVTVVEEFSKKQMERGYGRRYSQILQRNEYSAFLKLPEAQFSSVPTEVFLNPPTVENPGNNCLLEAGVKW
jgi:DICT domain-containing protein